MVAKLTINGQPAVSNGNSHTGNQFSVDGQHDQFNASTRGLPLGPTTLTVSLDAGTTHLVTVTLK